MTPHISETGRVMTTTIIATMMTAVAASAAAIACT
jgi:hypothetical protein